MVVVTLPFPPSTNALWRAVSGRNIKSADYRAWEREAGYVLASQRPGKIEGPFLIEMTFGRPDKRRRDLGNLEKSVSDLLVTHSVIPDDCLAQKITLRWGDVTGVRVEIAEAQ